jgi:isoleucyl-tRNA synthetase
VKAIAYVDDASGLLVKKVKPNFPKLGKQFGPRMKDVAAVIQSMSKEEITELEKKGALSKGGFDLVVEDVLISSEDIPGWAVASDGAITVALDIQVTDELRQEGIARDFVNRVQNLRKELGLEVLDKIRIELESNRTEQHAVEAIRSFSDYITQETQALSLEIRDEVAGAVAVDMDDRVLHVRVSKV